MNPTSLRSLEFETVRGLLLSYSGSSRGKLLLRSLAPVTDPVAVRGGLRTTLEAVALLENVGRQPYHDLPEIDAALAAARVRGHYLEPLQLADVASFIEGAAEIARRVAGCEAAGGLGRRAAQVADAGAVAQTIRAAILPSGEVADTASPRLGATRRAIVRLRAQLQGVMESYLRGKDADRLLQDKLVTTRNDRYVLLLKAEQRGQLPGIIHGSSGSGASFFVEPLPAVELNNDIVALAEEERAEIVRILRELTARVGERADDLEAAAEILAELDAAQAKAALAKEMDARAPEIVDFRREGEPASPEHAGRAAPARPGVVLLDLRDARHPLLMSRLTERVGIARRSPREPVPVSIRIDVEARVLVISGPNTGGKTVALKTVGLLALMAQSGLLIPAAAGSRLPVFRRIYADIGDDQSIAENLSTFSAHLKAIAGMTRDLDPPALVLLDEVGAGTDPTEGGALGVAIVEGFRRRGAVVVATTHHGLMKAYSQSTPGVACGSFGYDPETYEPTYRLRLDAPGHSLAFEMAERLGLPPDMVADGRARRDRKEAQAAELLKALEEKEARLAAEATRIAQLALEAERARDATHEAEQALLARKRADVESFAKELRRHADAAARQAADAIQEAVRKVESAQGKLAAAAGRARSAAIAEIREAHAEAVREQALGVPPEPEPAAAIARGSRVRVATLGIVGEVVELHGEREVEVAVAGKRLRVPREAVASVPARPGRSTPAAGAGVTAVDTSPGAPAEINLVGLRVDEALPQVDRLLDRALLADQRQVRVIHGFGQGKLRRAIAEFLAGHPQVASFRPGGAREGGGGATIVELKD